MQNSFIKRLKRAWKAFKSEDKKQDYGFRTPTITTNTLVPLHIRVSKDINIYDEFALFRGYHLNDEECKEMLKREILSSLDFRNLLDDEKFVEYTTEETHNPEVKRVSLKLTMYGKY
jgi:hypothetical protein